MGKLREKLNDLDGGNCALPLALEAMGERWSFMILRAALNGVRHFEDFLDERWDSGVISVYADCEGGDTLARIAHAEKWLAGHPRDGARSGLAAAAEILDGIDGIHFAVLDSSDVVRHRLVSDIVDAYERFEAARPAGVAMGNRAQRRAAAQNRVPRR